MEYAYAAWEQLGEPQTPDLLAPFRAVTTEDLLALHDARLRAIERIAAEVERNDWAMKASFDLANLENFEDVADSFAVALDEVHHHRTACRARRLEHERAVTRAPRAQRNVDAGPVSGRRSNAGDCRVQPRAVRLGHVGYERKSACPNRGWPNGPRIIRLALSI
ncbi:MAG: hypothetical protein R2848_12060 [Thermomicrobiales bacterium]